MSVALAVLVGFLFAVGTFLLMHRTLTRLVLGVAVLGNAVNLLIIATGGGGGTAPILPADGPADPLPQALVLTAIVIGFALQAFLLALAWRNWTMDGNDVVEDDLEDRRVAAQPAQTDRVDESELP